MIISVYAVNAERVGRLNKRVMMFYAQNVGIKSGHSLNKRVITLIQNVDGEREEEDLKKRVQSLNQIVCNYI